MLLSPSVQRYADKNIVLMKKGAPCRIQQTAVGLNGIPHILLWLAKLFYGIRKLLIEGQSGKQRLSALKGEGDIGIPICSLKHLLQQCHSYLIAHTPVVRTASIFCNILIEAIGAVQLTACGYRLDQK